MQRPALTGRLRRCPCILCARRVARASLSRAVLRPGPVVARHGNPVDRGIAALARHVGLARRTTCPLSAAVEEICTMREPLRFAKYAIRVVAVAALLSACSPPPRAGAPVAPAAPANECTAPPISTPLFLRGSMSNWALDDSYAFQYHCRTFVLNVNLSGAHRFRIADTAFSPA